MSVETPVSGMDILMIQQLVAEGFLPPEDGDTMIARVRLLLDKRRGVSSDHSSPASASSACCRCE